MFNISVDLDQQRAEEIYREEARKRIIELEEDKVYWTIKDLRNHTGMSEPYIREHILFDPSFPAWREGTHWRMLSGEAKVYLEQRAKRMMHQQNRAWAIAQ